MNVNNYIYGCLDSLSELGIESLEDKEKTVGNILQMPADMLEDMDKGQILGLILDNIGQTQYLPDTNQYKMLCRQVYSFDMEVSDISTMYTVFLNFVNLIINGDLQISDIVEDISNIDFEHGTGVHIISFKCNEEEYKYEAESNYDWFDMKVISFINQILDTNGINKHLYITSDGWQNCIVFYNTEEWAKKFNDTFDLKIEKA